MTKTTTASGGAAEAAWTTANALAESTQAAVRGTWLASDSAAESCGNDGVHWGITRLGPGTDTQARSAALDGFEELWNEAGYDPDRISIGGDAPGTELRYPRSGTLDTGFFIEFGTTEHGSTLQMQTPCAPGDADALNRAKYAERHTNTPPDIPGAATPSTATGS